MNSHEDHLSVNAWAIAETLVRHGVADSEAHAFDVVFRPSESIFALGYYEPNTGNEDLTLTDGSTVALQDRALSVRVLPSRNLSTTFAKFTLLHEAGHMYRDLILEDNLHVSYNDEGFMTRAKRRGAIGLGVFAASCAGLYGIDQLDEGLLRTVAETVDVGVAAVGMGFGLYRLAPPVAAWVLEPEEWRAHSYAIRNWSAPVVNVKET